MRREIYGGIVESGQENLIQLRQEAAKLVVESNELETRRKIFFKACEIVQKQFDHDARKMEESAIVSEHTIQRRHELMDTARCLRVSQTWLANLQMPVEATNGNGEHEQA